MEATESISMEATDSVATGSSDGLHIFQLNYSDPTKNLTAVIR